jgi:hypothetical protein
MIEKQAFELVSQYLEGWKQNNLNMIKSCLKEDCIVIESHGPTYHGIRDIENWFKFWLEAKSKVLKWDIISFSFCNEEKIVFCEWDFSCISDDNEYALPGISVVKFSDQKISFIHEYRMTNSAYKWNGDKLETD